MSLNGKRVKPATTGQGNHAPCDGNYEEEGLNRGDHPLLNDLILETLFGFVRRFDLKSCRGVCKKWNLHTIPHMRNHFKVTIRGSHSNCKTGQDTRRIGNFVELFNSNRLGIPFEKFVLGPFRTTDEVGQQFLQLCGEIVSEIDLDEENDGKSEVYTVEDVSDLLRGCPNLKVLTWPYNHVSRSGNIVKLFPHSKATFSSLKKITFRTDFENGRLKFCPTSIEELLSSTPNISDISVSDDFDEEDEDVDSDTDVVLNCIEKLGLEKSIQSLFIDSAKIGNVEHLKRMSKTGLKLKSLNLGPYLNADDLDLDLDTVQIQLATCFKDTLQSLNIQESVENILMKFPYMPELKSLSVRACYDFVQKPVNLNINFPALQTLDINFEGSDEEDWDEFFSKYESCPTLKSLIAVNQEMKIHGFHNILRVFPNLTKLNLRIGVDGVEILRQIWSQMTGLESLSVSGYIERREKEYLDSLFTGIPTQALKRITPVVNSLERMTVPQRRETIEQLQNDHSRLPSLRNLTKLRHLDLDVSGGENCHVWMNERTIHVTDLTGYLALYSMSHLNHLKLNQCELTKTCCETLTKETGLECWSIQNNQHKYIIPRFLPHGKENHYN